MRRIRRTTSLKVPSPRWSKYNLLIQVSSNHVINSLTKHVGEVSAGDLQQEDVNGRVEVGVDDLGDVAGQNFREIGQSAAGRLDGRDRDLVVAEGAAQHGEEMPDILPFNMQYQ